MAAARPECYERVMHDLRWVALLRGINVGRHNRIAMADLRAALAAAGMPDALTYIQTGNIVLDRPVKQDAGSIARAIEEVLERDFGMAVPVMVRSLDDVDRVASSHPELGGGVPPNWLHAFLLDREPDPDADLDSDRFAPDRWVAGEREIYVTYPDGPSRSKLTIDVIERAFDATATARNLTTLTKVVELGRRA